jgi:hypothetical protein
MVLSSALLANDPQKLIFDCWGSTMSFWDHGNWNWMNIMRGIVNIKQCVMQHVGTHCSKPQSTLLFSLFPSCSRELCKTRLIVLFLLFLQRNEKIGFALPIIRTVRGLGGRFVELTASGDHFKLIPEDETVVKLIYHDLDTPLPPQAAAKAPQKEGTVTQPRINNNKRPSPHALPPNPPPVEKVGTVVQPRNNDVVLGRGNGVAKHPGNVQFREYCWAVRESYHKAWR